MVARIKTGKSLRGALYYNESKVDKGKAELLEASGYFRDKEELTYQEKLWRLTDLAGRNHRTRTNTLHVSLNFPSGEDLSHEILKQIAADYITGIGFKNQPYLLYRHFDAGHPHVHLLTTNIKPNGERISLHYLGQDQSERTRKEIEKVYGLVPAEEQQAIRPEKEAIKPAIYGKLETRKQISAIVSAVIRQYTFTSIGEFDAILQTYNITADKGTPNSRMMLNGGLAYWILDAQGQRTGVPIKASSLYGKPTLTNLDKHFALNRTLCKPLVKLVRNDIENALRDSKTSKAFQENLARKSITLVSRQNEEGRTFGITFVDHQRKAAFNGSVIGKPFSANILAAHFELSTTHMRSDFGQTKITSSNTAAGSSEHKEQGLLDALFTKEFEGADTQRKPKRKKKRGQRL